MQISEKQIIERIQNMQGTQIIELVDSQIRDMLEVYIHEVADSVFKSDKGKKLIEATVYLAMKDYLKDEALGEVKDLVQEALYDTGALYDISQELAKKLSKVSLTDLVKK